MVLDVTNAATVQSGMNPAKRLAIMDLLYPGDQITTPSGSKVLVVFTADQHRAEVQPGMKATLTRDRFTPETAAKRIDSNHSPIVAERLQELQRSGRGATAVLRSPAVKPSEKVIIPIPDSTVLSDRPTLTWPKVDNAKNYRVELLAGGSGRLLWRREMLKENTLPFPKEEKELTRGRIYRWRVYAEDDKDDIHEVANTEFLVASKNQHDELQQLAPLIAQEAPVADLVLAALTFERERANHEALITYERLAKLSPHEAAFHAACAQLYERAGRPEDAKKAWAKAKELGYVGMDR
jgi:hypothetical protein